MTAREMSKQRLRQGEMKRCSEQMNLKLIITNKVITRKFAI